MVAREPGPRPPYGVDMTQDMIIGWRLRRSLKYNLPWPDIMIPGPGTAPNLKSS
jgi:hypothetical protein